MDKDKKIAQEIIDRCNMGIILLSIIDIILILFFFIALTINIGAILCALIFILIVSYFIIFCKKVKKEPLKYRKYFLNLKSDKNMNSKSINSINEYEKEDGFAVAQEQEMEKRRQLADEFNAKFEYKTDDIVFSDNDMLRIEKNCKIMENLGLPYFKEMKLVPVDSNTKIKTKEEIILQMIFDFFVGHKAENKLNNISDMQDLDVMSLAMKYPINEMFSALSQISKGEIDDVMLNELAYLYEQANVFAWVLGLKEKPSETQLSDESELHSLLLNFQNVNDIINKSKMISNEEIMEYADLITRYEWAMIELKRTNNVSKDINNDCIIEHKKAVDFLTSYDPDVYLEKNKE